MWRTAFKFQYDGSFTPPRSQKARGFLKLRKGHSFNDCRSPAGLVISEEGLLEGAWQYMEHVWIESCERAAEERTEATPLRIFARPCPVRPRHGFVDSRIVSSLDELRAVWAETKAADPEGEIILMEYVDATWNAVITPSTLTVAPWNDGATSGRGAVTLALPFRMENPLFYKLKHMGGCEDTPYVEVVGDDVRADVVQVRDGVAPPSTGGNYIPKWVFELEWNSTKVITLTDDTLPDLLEWEKTCNKWGEWHRSRNGDLLCVIHKGGSLTSHYAVHCLANEIPFFTKPGESKAYVGGGFHFRRSMMKEASGISPLDPESMVAGIVRGSTFPLKFNTNTNDAMHIVLHALHNASLTGGTDGGYVMGMAAALGARLGVVACVGEARHHKDSPDKNKSRGQLYYELLKRYKDALDDELLQRFFDGAELFLDKNMWGDHTSLGGKKWATCAAVTTALLKACQEHCRYQNAYTVKEVISALNTTVNTVHNGGPMYDKFISRTMFDRYAQGTPSDLIITARAYAKVLFAPPLTVAQAIAVIERWRSVVLKSVKEREHVPVTSRAIYAPAGVLMGAELRMKPRPVPPGRYPCLPVGVQKHAYVPIGKRAKVVQLLISAKIGCDTPLKLTQEAAKVKTKVAWEELLAGIPYMFNASVDTETMIMTSDYLPPLSLLEAFTPERVEKAGIMHEWFKPDVRRRRKLGDLSAFKAMTLDELYNTDGYAKYVYKYIEAMKAGHDPGLPSAPEMLPPQPPPVVFKQFSVEEAVKQAAALLDTQPLPPEGPAIPQGEEVI